MRVNDMSKTPEEIEQLKVTMRELVYNSTPLEVTQLQALIEEVVVNAESKVKELQSLIADMTITLEVLEDRSK